MYKLLNGIANHKQLKIFVNINEKFFKKWNSLPLRAINVHYECCRNTVVWNSATLSAISSFVKKCVCYFGFRNLWKCVCCVCEIPCVKVWAKFAFAYLQLQITQLFIVVAIFFVWKIAVAKTKVLVLKYLNEFITIFIIV